MGMFPSIHFSLPHSSRYSYPNMGIGQDPPYAYKDKTDNYEAALNAQRVRQIHFPIDLTDLLFFRKILLIIKLP